MGTGTNPIRGVVPVLATPFNSDGSLDRTSFRRYAEHVMQLDISAFMFPGFASESHKLDGDERDVLIGDVLEIAAGHSAVLPILGVTEQSTYAAVRRVHRLRDMGARAINLLPPTAGSATKQATLDHICEVAGAAGGLPIVLQYAPHNGGAVLTPEDIVALSVEIPGLEAVKVEARPPGEFIRGILDLSPSIKTLVGSGGLYLLEALRSGAVGVQPGASLTEVYVRIWSLWTAGAEEDARLLYDRLIEYLVGWTATQESIVAIEKVIAFRRRLIDQPTCRAPHHAVAKYDDQRVSQVLQDFASLLSGV